MRNLTPAIKTPLRQYKPISKSALDRVISFIDHRLSREILIEQLAAVAVMSPYHFGRCFKTATGMSPYAFITARRMAKAKALLAETDLALPDIAEKVGFSNLGHFRKQFRKQFGFNPSDVRRKAAA